MKLTKQQARLHTQAESRLAQDVLSRDDKLFVLEHWREDANQFTELPDAAQYRACITCPVFAICPQPTPWPRGECCREGHDVEHRSPGTNRCTECERERDWRRRGMYASVPMARRSA